MYEGGNCDRGGDIQVEGGNKSSTGSSDNDKVYYRNFDPFILSPEPETKEMVSRVYRK